MQRMQHPYATYVRRTHLQDVSGSMVKPGVSTSPLRAGKTVKKGCPKCMAEADFM